MERPTQVPYDPSSIPLGEKKENKRERDRGWLIKNYPLTIGMKIERCGLVVSSLVWSSIQAIRV